ncbi:hypothetical protein [Hymenobacter metallilatus]|uniref:Lipocalin-like domain-containing protein n=1 Tax=Hymenobacter metallilatus TaxID=2493666 RepID=A0A3R9UF25_9BACT|nr:hypothetical protein [Hymenobacter metallilatus]RSK29611.1 hypothetical protein EI290_17230 [Hymenobacter metallilatus]
MKWFLFLWFLGATPLLPSARPPQSIPRKSPSFFATYTYLTYAILDKGTSPTPLAAKGVGGTLQLRADGTYQKRLTLAGNGTTLRFDQDGRFVFAADSIRFLYTRNGQPHTDRGVFRLRNGLLTITLAGFPVGNQSIYTLRMQ